MASTPSPSRAKRLAAGAATLVVGAAVAVAVTASSGQSSSKPEVPPGEAVIDPTVAKALVEAQCSQMLERGPNNGPRQVVLLDRTGEMAGAGLPRVVLDAIGAATEDGQLGSLTLALVGGEDEAPRVVLDGAALVDPEAGDARRQRIIDHVPACLDAALGALPEATAPGSDVLYAEQTAARLARSAVERGADDVRLYLVTDGAANTGLLDLRTQGYPLSDPSAVVRRVKQAGDLPDLADVPVVLVGVGQQFQEGQRRWLEDLHLGLCTAGGGNCEVSADQVPLDPSAGSVPPDPDLSSLEPVPGAPRGTVAINPAAFAADSTDLLDPAALRASLRPLVRSLTDDPRATLRLVGHACDDGSPTEALVTLSQARARTIARLVRPLVPAATRVEHLGVGGSEPVPVPDGTSADRTCELQRTVVLRVLRDR